MVQQQMEPPDTQCRTLALYAGTILGFTVVVLIFAAVIGAHRAYRLMPLGTPIPDEGRTHVTAFSSFTNQYYPPFSGPHYADALKPGVYLTPVSGGSYVHNLEHGYIVVLFKRTIDNGLLAAQQLQDLPTRFPTAKYGSVKLIVAPYDDMPYPVVALAWDRELPLMVADQRTLVRFYRQYVDHGPEDAP